MAGFSGGGWTREDTTADAVFDVIVAQLRTELDLDESTCFETLSPLSAPFNPLGGDYFVTVSPGEGQFVHGEQVEDNVSEESNVRVTGYTRIQADDLEKDYSRLHDESRGLLKIKHDILKALCGQDLPLKEDIRFLRQPLFCTHCTAPDRGIISDTHLAIAWITLTFGVDFDWDIS